MKRVLTSVAFAIALFGFVGCGGDGAGDRDGDTTAMDTSGLDVDSGAGGTQVSVETDDTYTFEGNVTSVSGDMVSVDHDEIRDYKAAGTNSFKLADAQMAQHVKKGDRRQFKLKVVGDQALITSMEPASGDGDRDTTGVDARDNDANDDDLDTIGSNRNVDRKEGDETKVGENDRTEKK